MNSKASDYRSKMNQAFARAYGQRPDEGYGHQKHPEGVDSLGQWIVNVDPNDIDLVDVINRRQFARAYADRQNLYLEVHYVELKGFNHWEGKDHAIVMTGMDRKTIVCKMSATWLLPDTKQIKVTAYMDGQLIIEQFAVDDVRPTHVVEDVDGSGKAETPS